MLFKGIRGNQPLTLDWYTSQPSRQLLSYTIQHPAVHTDTDQTHVLCGTFTENISCVSAQLHIYCNTTVPYILVYQMIWTNGRMFGVKGNWEKGLWQQKQPIPMPTT